MSFVTTRRACSQLGVHPNTLRNWDKAGKIRTQRTPGGMRRYDLASLALVEKRKFIYARVSSRGQKGDLQKQIQYLRARYPYHELIEDFGSGLNFKRKGLNTLLESIMQGQVGEVVVTHKDRLCRFGFELIESLAHKNDCQLVVLDRSPLPPQAELVQDLLSIIHVFSCRLYGLRKYSRQIIEDQDLSQKPISHS